MKLEQRFEAIKLRKRGESLKEISYKLKVAKSSVSLWVRNVPLSQTAKNKLLEKIKIGQFISAENKKARVKSLEEKYLSEAVWEIKNNPDFKKIICAVMYWCEGTKNPRGGMTFTNSDPNLVKKFLELLRVSFELDERKFHPCIHLHGYHFPQKQLEFWSKMTHIPKEQFIKPYLKPNTGRNIHEGYEGCISIRYGSTDLARRLNAIAKAFLMGV